MISKYHIHIAALFLFFAFGCSPKVVEPIVEEPKEEPTIKEPEERLTECTTFFDVPAAQRGEIEDAYVLYRDQIRFKKWDRARQLWKKAFYGAPGSNGRVTYQYEDGVKIYMHFFEQAETTESKQAIVDTIMSIYDKRIECFADDGTVLARRAFDSYYTLRDFTDEDETFALFKEVLSRKGKEADYFIINPMSRMLYDFVLDKKISNDEASEMAYQIFDAIEHGKANCEDVYCEAWETIDAYSPDLLSGLEGIKGFYNCDYYMTRYYDQYLADTSDCDNVRDVYLKLVWAGCDQTEARFQQIKATKERVCYVAPPPPGPLKLAYQALNDGRFTEAVDYYNQYISETDDPEKKADKLLLISKIYYAHIKNYPEARRYALAAAKERANWGEPYILIGKLYASSGPLCGPGRGWDSQMVTWPAIDKFNYAKKIDPSVTDEANKWIRRYQKYMPSTEDIFIRQKKAGDRIKVGCWIQETTTIRPARD